MKEYVNGKYIDVDDIRITEPPKNEQILALKTELSTYDYIGVKIAMGVATKEKYAEQIAYTEQLREKIRKLEEEIWNEKEDI